MWSLGYTNFTNMVKVNERIVYSPMIVFAQSPISYTQKFSDLNQDQQVKM